MLKIFDQDGTSISDKIFLNKSSSNRNCNRTLVVFSSTDITVKSEAPELTIASLVNNELNLTSFKILSPNVQGLVTINLNIFGDPGTYLLPFIISNSSESVNLLADIELVENDDRLTVLLNNNGIEITDIWYSAIKSSTSELDYVLLNQKKREFLLELINLTGVIGSYLNLDSVLDFFEWKDIVSIKEYWKSQVDSNGKEKYKLTAENQQFLNQDLLKDGYIKLNWLNLNFQINQPDGTYDSDGFANFIDIDLAIDDIWIKLYYLKSILQDTFLPDNVRIIDIIAEHTSIAGIDLNHWLNFAVIDNTEPIPTLNFLTVESNSNLSKQIAIQDNYCLRVTPLSINDQSIIVTGPTAHPTDKIFEIIKTREQLQDSELDNLQLLTEFYRGDFGQLDISIDVSDLITASNYQYKIGIQEKILDDLNQDWQTKYLSPLYSIIDLQKHLHFGIIQPNFYRLVIYGFDAYGAFDVIIKPIEFQINQRVLDLQLYQLNPAVDTVLPFDNRFYTTANTHLSDLIVPDAADLSFNIADRSTAIAGRYYASEQTLRNFNTTNNRYNLMAIKDLNTSRIFDYSTTHEVLFFDLSSGTIKFMLKVFDRHQDSTIYGSSTSTENLITLCKSLNFQSNQASWKNVYSRYTWSIVNRSIDGTLTNIKPMIMAFAKKPDTDISKFISVIPDYEKSKLRLLGLNTCLIRIQHYIVKTDTLMVTIDSVVHNLGMVTINTLQDLANKLATLPILNLTSSTGTLLISCRYDLSISHASIGLLNEVIRNVPYQNIDLAEIGQDFAITSPIFSKATHRFNLADYLWTITNHFTQKIVHTENNEILAWIPFENGIYDVKLQIFDQITSMETTCQKLGGIRVVSGQDLQKKNISSSYVQPKTTKLLLYYSANLGLDITKLNTVAILKGISTFQLSFNSTPGQYLQVLVPIAYQSSKFIVTDQENDDISGSWQNITTVTVADQDYNLWQTKYPIGTLINYSLKFVLK